MILSTNLEGFKSSKISIDCAIILLLQTSKGISSAIPLSIMQLWFTHCFFVGLGISQIETNRSED